MDNNYQKCNAGKGERDPAHSTGAESSKDKSDLGCKMELMLVAIEGCVGAIE